MWATTALYGYHTILVIMVVFRYDNWITLLVAFLLWKLAWQLLVR